MFRTPFFLTLAGLTIFAVGIFRQCVFLEEGDRLVYNQLMAQNQERILAKNKERAPLCQERKGGVKKIWGSAADISLCTDTSELAIFQKKGKIRVRETMAGIEGTHIKKRESASEIGSEKRPGLASRHSPYETLSLSAEQGELWLPSQEGKFQEVSIQTRNPLGETMQAQGSELFLEKEEIRLVSAFLCAGRETADAKYALADQAILSPREKKLILSACEAPNARVLFWHQGTEISAPLLEIRLPDQIQAYGDMHLFFNPENQESTYDSFRSKRLNKTL